MKQAFHYLSICSFLSLALFSCKTEYPGQEPDLSITDAPIPVQIVPISPSTDPIPIEAGGTIGSKSETRLSFKIGGIIDRTYKAEGQTVRKGQLLAQLKTTEIDAQVMKAEQAQEKAERDLARFERLYADSAATLETVQNLRTALEVAESDLRIANFNQQYARIIAPVSGRIVKRFAEAGELIGPGQPVYMLAGEGQRGYVLRVGVADRQMLYLKLGDKAEIRLDAYPDEVVPASVTEIAAAADPRTGTFEIELTLDAGQRVIRNGFIGRAIIYPSRQPAHYRLPLDALVAGKGEIVNIFYPGPDDIAYKKEVRVIQLLDDEFLVPATALSDVSEVITRGAAYLNEGAKFTRQ